MTFGFIVTDTFIPCALDVLADHPDISGSHHIKHVVYEKTFGIKFRHKYTGFEYIQDLDAEYREKFKKILQTEELTETVTTTVPQSIKESLGQICGVSVVPPDENNPLLDEQGNTLPGAHEQVVDSSPEENIERYRNFLINRAKQYANDAIPPIVYYSGGGDSEMVVQSFLAAQVPFYAVCFLLVCDGTRMDIDNMIQAQEDLSELRSRLPEYIFEELRLGEVFLNLPEAVNAFDSSQKHGFNLAVRLVNVLDIWDSPTIGERLRKDRITSPMILTQRLMTEMVTEEMKILGDKYIKQPTILRVEI